MVTPSMTVWLRPIPPLTILPGALATLAAVGGCTLALTLLGGGPAPASPGPAPEVSRDAEPMLRVRVIRRSPEIAIDDPGVRVSLGGPGPGEALSGVRLLRVQGGQVVVVGQAGEVACADEVELTHPAGVRAGGRVLPASVRVRAGADGLDAIAPVPLETYVAGVVSAEMYAHWPEASLDAQSIVARSYARHECLRAQGRAWDIESTAAHQALAQGANAAALAAARRTRGLVLVHQGQVLRAYYSSTCGGRSASARDHWGASPETAFNDVPPLRAHDRLCPCDDSPRHRWRVTMSVAELRDRLRAYGVRSGVRLAEIGTPRSCEVIERNEVGRPTRYRVMDDRGQRFDVRAEPMRLACNAAPDEPARIAGTPSAPPPPGVAPGPAPEPASDVEGAGEAGAALPRPAAWSNDFEVQIARGEVMIEGRGFGHGVGLCQYGAKALAEQGWSPERILEHYYPGAAVEILK